MSNVGISEFWVRWLQLRGLPGNRIYDAVRFVYLHAYLTNQLWMHGKVMHATHNQPFRTCACRCGLDATWRSSSR